MADQDVTLAPAGLEGLAVVDTELSYVNGQAGWYTLRGYDPAELARQAPFEAVWHLLFEGRLPDQDELAAYRLSPSSGTSSGRRRRHRSCAPATPMLRFISGRSVATSSIRGGRRGPRRYLIL